MHTNTERFISCNHLKFSRLPQPGRRRLIWKSIEIYVGTKRIVCPSEQNFEQL